MRAKSSLIGLTFIRADYMNIVQLKHALRSLSLGQLRKLDEWLHELIRNAEEAERTQKSLSRRRDGTEQTFDGRTYMLESIRCGKEKCKCTRGKLHGPYWYSYTRVKDRVISKYVGKSLPKAVEKEIKNQGER